GRTLAEWLAARGAGGAPARAGGDVVPGARGPAGAPAPGLVPRGLKPPNVVLPGGGGGEGLRFGSAHLVGSREPPPGGAGGGGAPVRCRRGGAAPPPPPRACPPTRARGRRRRAPRSLAPSSGRWRTCRRSNGAWTWWTSGPTSGPPA